MTPILHRMFRGYINCHINTFGCIYTFINTMYMLSVCLVCWSSPKTVSNPTDLLTSPPGMSPRYDLAYQDCYLYGYSHATDINRHQDRYTIYLHLID